MSVLSEPQYHSEEDAYAFVEAHVWASGRVCPHCGVFDKSGLLKARAPVSGSTSAMPAGSRLLSRSGPSSRPATSNFISGCKRSSCFARLRGRLRSPRGRDG